MMETVKIAQALENLKGEFWTNLEDVVADIYAAIHEVVENVDIQDVTREYVVAGWTADDEDVQWSIDLGGTERTIVIKSFEEVYRG